MLTCRYIYGVCKLNELRHMPIHKPPPITLKYGHNPLTARVILALARSGGGPRSRCPAAGDQPGLVQSVRRSPALDMCERRGCMQAQSDGLGGYLIGYEIHGEV